ncbi:MAG: hypothetical protein RL404_269, partial [Pseudomonadota bacterium]
NELIGNAGNNWLDGAGGADTMAGQGGNDTYVVDDVGDVIEERAGDGIDTVVLRLAQGQQCYTVGDHVERVLVKGRVNVDVRGNDSGNTLVGNAGDNRLWGLGGDDVLSGGTRGVDFLYGGAGDDVYLVQQARTMALEVEQSGADAGGHDTVISRVKEFALGLYVEDLVLSGGAEKGWGNSSANKLVGNALDNVLAGVGGDDVLAGGAGRDVLIGGSGADWFLLDALEGGVDALTDFDAAQGDQIGVQLTAAVRKAFQGGLADQGGHLAAGTVTCGAGLRMAQDGDDRFIYDSSSGLLRWDADGAGGAAAVEVAVVGLQGHRPATLTSDDFFLFS